jgi:RNA polymerase sigma factor for flagellar operon FliA
MTNAVGRSRTVRSARDRGARERESPETRLLEKFGATIEQTARTLIDYAPTYVDLEDLVQAGTLGLLKAFRRARVRGTGDDEENYLRTRIWGSLFDEVRRTGAVPRELLTRQRRESGENREPAKERRLEAQDQAELAQVRQLWTLAQKAINRLPQSERSVLLLFYLRGATMHEIGEVLGVSESRASQLHHAALARLRVRMRRFAS